MTQMRRRDVLLAGLAVPAMVGTLRGEQRSDKNSVKPQRLEDTAGFEVADVVFRSHLAILPLGSLECRIGHVVDEADHERFAGFVCQGHRSTRGAE